MLDNKDALLDKVDTFVDWTNTTPGACLGGRAIATDDPDALGWDIIKDHLLQDGMFVFRHVPVAAEAALEAKVKPWGYGLSSWRVFYGSPSDISTSRQPRRSTTDFDLTCETNASANTIADVMSFLRAHGMKPFSGQCLSGLASPSALVTVRGSNNALQAVAFGHFCFNAHSKWHGTAWCGLVAVDEKCRGSGLGRAVNDAVIDAMIDQHGATAIVEYAAEDNMPSRRMIEGSGLSLRDDILTYAATRGGVRNTR